MTTITPRSHPRGHWLVPLVIALLVAGCNDDGTDVQSEPINGTWVAQFAEGNLYVVITDDSLVYYTEANAEDCADRYTYELEPLGDDRYQLTSTVNAATFENSITAANGQLSWNTGGGSVVFQRATGVDPSTLAVCAGGGDDPALVCSELPALSLAQDTSETLAQEDDFERGRYYDVYGFQPDSQMTAVISLESPDFDPYLYVYDADGTLLAENDDVASSANAGLTLEVVPVCYRVEVTSFDNEATGSYTLRVD